MKILNNIFNSLIVPITMFAYGDLTKVNIEKAKGHKKVVFKKLCRKFSKQWCHK